MAEKIKNYVYWKSADKKVVRFEHEKAQPVEDMIWKVSDKLGDMLEFDTNLSTYFTRMVRVRKGVRLEFGYSGEDLDGSELLCFSLSLYDDIFEVWEQIEGGMHCTALTKAISHESKDKAMQIIMDELYPLAVQRKPLETACQSLAAMDITWIEILKKN